MPVHPFDPARGRVETLTIDSKALAGNLLGDPTRRTVAVYLPQGYDSGDADYPLFVDFAGFTGSGLKRLSWSAFGESTPQRIDRLIAEGKMGPTAYLGDRSHLYVYLPGREEPVSVAQQNLERATSQQARADQPVWLNWAEDAVVLLPN